MKMFFVAALAMSSATAASAAVLDFTSLGSGNIGTATASVAGANITSFGSSLFVGAGGNANSICALDGDCANDLEITFTDAVKNVTFDQGTWNPGDVIDVMIYGLANSFIGTYVIDSAASVDLSSFGTITRLFFDDQNSTGAGTAYANVTYDRATAAVPLPAGLPLLGFGAAALFGVSRKKRRS